jgi:lipopolysaccharide transport protein LptA
MKKIIFSLALLAGGLAAAQTNAPAGSAAPRPPTEINSDTADFDMNARQAVYRGHVVVVDPQMTLKCDQLVVFIPPTGERLNHIEAQTNVVIDFIDSHGQTAHATGDLGVYRYSVQNGSTNETVTLTGSPQVESPQGTLTGSEIIWDRASNRLSAKNPIMKFKRDLNDSPGTNASPVKLF